MVSDQADERALSALATAVAEGLQRRARRLTTAESCTGGWVSQSLTAIAGSSAWFDRGFVTYSNAAKIDMLGVSEHSLAEHGAVSEPVALEMACGALQRSRADIALSITGIAGPAGGSAQKPVGTVCFGWAWKALPETAMVNNLQPSTAAFHSLVLTLHLSGDRAQVRRQAVLESLSGVLRCLNGGEIHNNEIER
jgi:nicotinamide-nucleotide amidase